MEKLIIYKNKGEVFRCQLEISGANTTDAKARLCMEFEDVPNIYFNGTIDEDGICVFQIPKLTQLDEMEGKIIIEIIADETYFQVYEADLELKNSVNIKLTQKDSTPVVETKVVMNEILQQSSLKEEPLVQEEKIIKPVIKKPKKQIEPKPHNPNEWEPAKIKQFKKFNDYFKKK